MESYRIENCVTLVCIVALVLGLYAMSGSWHALWGLILMLNLNASDGKVKCRQP